MIRRFKLISLLIILASIKFAYAEMSLSGYTEFFAGSADQPTYQATEIERKVVASLEGNCLSPISALCKIGSKDTELKVRVSNQDGTEVYNDVIRFNLENKTDALKGFIETLIRNGAKEIIQQ